MRIANDKVVLIEYTMTDTEGEVLESTEESGPLGYVHGSGNILSGLEEALAGRAQGDELEVELRPEQAFGEYDQELVETWPRSEFDDADELEIGLEFEYDTDDGPEMATIVGIDEDEVHVDHNHPLAGVQVRLKVRVVEVREATPEELEHGHVHGMGGCEHDHDLSDEDDDWDEDDDDDEVARGDDRP
jgi:FKBP-type peptidyl-prolyl cis-trans isomerase SlyD